MNIEKTFRERKNMVKCELNKFKLMFMANTILDSKEYLAKFLKYLQNVKEIVFKNLAEKVNVKNIEIQVKDFYLDKENSQTLIYLDVSIFLEGDFDLINKQNPEIMKQLYNMIDGWLNSFDSGSKVSSKLKEIPQSLSVKRK